MPRHTTFLTELDHIEVEEGGLSAAIFDISGTGGGTWSAEALRQDMGGMTMEW